MTVNCNHCGGRSRVMETRQHVQIDWTRRGRPRQRHNVIRLRQCLNEKCRWRWKTMERVYVEKAKTQKAEPQEASARSRISVPRVRSGNAGPADQRRRATEEELAGQSASRAHLPQPSATSLHD